jgi:hypothetical protein
MTPAQKRAMRPYRKQLKQAFAEAAPTAATPGKARTWFVPYLAAVLKIYRELTTQIVGGRPLSRALAKQSRDAFFKLLKSSKRDPKTQSRWAAVLANAHNSDISPEQPGVRPSGLVAAHEATAEHYKNAAVRLGRWVPECVGWHDRRGPNVF